MTKKIEQNEIKEKMLSELFKFIKNADTMRFEVDSGIVSAVNKAGWKIHEYDGKSTITFYLYHKKRNRRPNLIEEIARDGG